MWTSERETMLSMRIFTMKDDDTVHKSVLDNINFGKQNSHPRPSSIYWSDDPGTLYIYMCTPKGGWIDKTTENHFQPVWEIL